MALFPGIFCSRFQCCFPRSRKRPSSDYFNVTGCYLKRASKNHDSLGSLARTNDSCRCETECLGSQRRSCGYCNRSGLERCGFVTGVAMGLAGRGCVGQHVESATWKPRRFVPKIWGAQWRGRPALRHASVPRANSAKVSMGRQAGKRGVCPSTACKTNPTAWVAGQVKGLRAISWSLRGIRSVRCRAGVLVQGRENPASPSPR